MPTRVCDLELVELDGLPAVPLRYEWLRLLVRLGGKPIGFLHLRNPRRDLDRQEIAEIVAGEFHGEIWARMRATAWVSSGSQSNGRRATPAIAVVVSGRGSLDELDRCLLALERQLYPSYEVVVAGFGPLDEAVRDVAVRRGARYVVAPVTGLNAARNHALTGEIGDVVAFTEPRSEPDPDWLERLADGFSSDGIVAVTGLVVPAELETSAQGMFEDLCGAPGKGMHPVVHCRRGRAMTYRPENYGSGSNLAVRRDVLRELGGFDIGFDAGAEPGGALDLLQRLVERDAAISHRPDAIVRRTHRRTVGALETEVAESARGRAAALRASLSRAGGHGGLRVTSSYAHWLWGENIRPVLRLRRRDELPRAVRRASLRGALAGGIVYGRARRRIAREA